MNDTHWRRLELLADLAREKANDFLKSDELTKLKKALQDAATELPETLSLSLDITLSAFDQERDASLPLTQVVLASAGSEEPYIAELDCSSQRYVVDGEVLQVPHDICPHCWFVWGFKIGDPDGSLPDRACPSCGYQMGKEIKLLLDNDLCPHCERGQVSLNQPKCSGCGMEIDAGLVAWG